MTKKSVKKLSIILGIVLIVLWFGGNLGLYVYMKYTYSGDMEKAANYVPEKLKLPKADIDAESLYFFRYKLKFPFYRENIVNIFPGFNHGEYEGENFSINIKKRFISISKLPPFQDDEMSLLDRFVIEDKSFFEYTRTMRYSRLKDYRWWNLFHNIRLYELLNTKTMFIPSRVYDLETPYLKGFFEEFNMAENKWLFSFTFELNNETYSIASGSVGEKKLNKFRDIITTIQPVDNIKNSYKEMEALYRDKKSRYPEELILHSMISLKGPTIEDLKELLRVMEEKNYHATTIENVKKEIEYLEKQ